MRSLGRRAGIGALVAAATLSAAGVAQAATVVWRCPGPPVLYTDQLSPAEAQARGCRTIDGAPVTVLHTAPRPPAVAAGAAPAATPRPP